MNETDLNKTSIKASACNKPKPAKFHRKADAIVESKKRIAIATFSGAKGINSRNLLFISTVQDLGLIIFLFIQCRQQIAIHQ